jgi:hypothetical protein
MCFCAWYVADGYSCRDPVWWCRRSCCCGFACRRSYPQSDWAGGSPTHPFVNLMTALAVIPGQGPARSIFYDRPGPERSLQSGQRGARCLGRHGHANSHLELTSRPGIPHGCGIGTAEPNQLSLPTTCAIMFSAGREDTALLRSNRSARPGPRFEGRTIRVVRRFVSGVRVCCLLGFVVSACSSPLRI